MTVHLYVSFATMNLHLHVFPYMYFMCKHDIMGNVLLTCPLIVVWIYFAIVIDEIKLFVLYFTW